MQSEITDMYNVFCQSLKNEKLPQLIKTTNTNVFMRAIIQDKPKYYQKLLDFPALITDQDIHGRTALTLAIQNSTTDDFIKKIVNTDPRVLTLMYQKQNPAMLLLGVTRHINSGIVLKEAKRDKKFVEKYFDFIMRSTLNNPNACIQQNEKGQNIAQLLQQEGYTQFNQDIANNPKLTPPQNNLDTQINEAVQKNENPTQIEEQTLQNNQSK